MYVQLSGTHLYGGKKIHNFVAILLPVEKKSEHKLLSAKRFVLRTLYKIQRLKVLAATCTYSRRHAGEKDYSRIAIASHLVIDSRSSNDEIYGEHSTCSRSWNSYPSCPSFFLLLLVRLEQLIL